MSVIDLHAHDIPEECLALERRGGDNVYGIRAEVVDGEPHVNLDGRLVLGPGIPGQSWMRGDGFAKLWDLDVRLADMKERGVTTQVIAVPPFMYFYGIDAQEGLACSRALNDGIAQRSPTTRRASSACARCRCRTPPWPSRSSGAASASSASRGSRSTAT